VATRPLEPFAPQDFDEPCEDCGAPAGAFCYDHCGSGYTADHARRQAEQRAAAQPDTTHT
jgi:hypothetical protein